MEEFGRKLLWYGKFLTDTEIEKNGNFIRIRLIEYENKKYLHIMVNGEIVKVEKGG